MAQRTLVQLIDDLDGAEAHESVGFGLDGVEYTIDLSKDNAKKLRDGLEEFVTKARRIGGRHSTNAPGKTRAAANGSNRANGNSKEQNAAIREWARKQGLKVSDRGRIAADITAMFLAEHAGA